MLTALHITLSVFALLVSAAPHPQEASQAIRIPITRSRWLNKRDRALRDEMEAASVHLSRTNGIAGDATKSLNDALPTYSKNKRASYASVPLSFAEGAYSAVVTIDKQNFEVICDTGSDVLWVAGSDCTGPNCEGHTLYDINNEEGNRHVHGPFNAEYSDDGGGDDDTAVTGTWHSSAVSMGGITAPDVSFGVAATLSVGYHKDTFPFDGILGLEIPDLSKRSETQMPPRQSFLEVLCRQGLIHRQAFSFKFSDDDTESELILGYSNILAYEGPAAVIPVLDPSQNRWIIQLDGISVDHNDPNNPILRQSAEALIDIGSTFCFGPVAVLRSMYLQIDGSSEFPSEMYPGMSGWTIPCETQAVVSLIFNGKSFPFAQKAFIEHGGDGTCYGSLYGHSEAHWEIGLSFLTGVYSTFEIKVANAPTPRVLFAKLLPGNTSSQFRQTFNFPPVAGSIA